MCVFCFLWNFCQPTDFCDYCGYSESVNTQSVAFDAAVVLKFTYFFLAQVVEFTKLSYRFVLCYAKSRMFPKRTRFDGKQETLALIIQVSCTARA